MRNALRIATATVIAASTLGMGVAQADSLDDYREASKNCKTWCLYEHYDYKNKLDGAGKPGDLPRHEWDRASSGINNTDKWMCMYSYDDKGRLNLVELASPRTGWTAGAEGRASYNDRIDYIRMDPDAPGYCPSKLTRAVTKPLN